MNDYTGKICPFCQTEFKPNDEIVVCSECDMPHHKDCWIENQGCTTFGCLGAIKAVDNVETSVTSQNVISGDVFSQSPYATQNPYTAQNPYMAQKPYTAGYNSYQGVDIDVDVQRLVGTKTEYYIPKFREMKVQNKQTSWNWAAFLVAPYWMIYRKMYAYGAGLLAVSFIFSLVESAFASLLLLAGYVVLGLYSNNIYMKYLEEKAMQLKSMNEPLRSQFMAQNSGVNDTAAVLSIVGYALLTIILAM